MNPNPDSEGALNTLVSSDHCGEVTLGVINTHMGDHLGTLLAVFGIYDLRTIQWNYLMEPK